jgi:hypothetical protein
VGGGGGGGYLDSRTALVVAEVRDVS